MTKWVRHAVILAAGRGIRMLPLTNVMPKAMAPYNGSTLIAAGIERIREQVPFVHITVGHHGAMLAEHVIHHGVSTVVNTTGHGNAWWLFNTFLSMIDEPLVVLTCDNVTNLDFSLLENDYVRYGSPACMLVPVEPVRGLEGDFIFHDDHVVQRLSRTKVAPTYCSGIQIVNPTRIRNLIGDGHEDFQSVWSCLIPLGEVRASSVYPHTWFTVDTIEHLRRLSEMTAAGFQRD